MNVEIISVGSELLLGQIANTDAQYLSQKLSEYGINTYYHTVVGDNPQRLETCLEVAYKRVDTVITTGGLGPTMDDLTKETVCKFLGKPCVLHQESYDRMMKRLAKYRKSIPKNNDKQCLFPKDAIVLQNDHGTAPGAIITKDDKTCIILPGPPHELQPMVDNYLTDWLSKQNECKITSRVIKFYGIGESLLETRIKDILINQSNPTVAPLIKDGAVTLRVTAKHNLNENPDDYINPMLEKIKSIEGVGEYIFGYDDDTLASVVADLLKEKSLTISFAESCTGGMVSSQLVNIPGVSDVYKEGYVVYSNEAKMKLLGVDEEILINHGAVSEECVIAMAKGLYARTKANVCLCISGIAGPGGGTKEKPVGLVYVSVNINGKIKTQKLQNSNGRYRIRYRSALTALDFVRKELIKL